MIQSDSGGSVATWNVALWLVDRGAGELTLAAAAGFLVGGLDDLLLDLMWLGRSLWRRIAVYSRFARADAGTLPPPQAPGRLAVVIPAWDESRVIAAMLRHALATFDHADYRLYVGVYPNDPATQAAVLSVADARIRMVVGPRDGGTTKADCLNTIWAALVADEIAEGVACKAIVMHDAEDVVHSAELALFDRMIERFDLVQLPVLPLVDRASRWISGHYLDEFAEAHGKDLVLREAIGAAVPSAGVGCAVARGAMGRLADLRGGRPFDDASLTEDYELGLRLAEFGGRAAFVRLPGRGRRGVVATREHFPATLDDAVRQKARWMTGIALAGWDRLGWRGGVAESWMRLRDRKSVAAALLLVVGYAGLALTLVSLAAHYIVGGTAPPRSAAALRLYAIVTALLGWRLVMRFAFTTRAYGWREGLRALPRVIVANIVAIAAARRALAGYVRAKPSAAPRWDKTAHRFPVAVPAE